MWADLFFFDFAYFLEIYLIVFLNKIKISLDCRYCVDRLSLEYRSIVFP